MKITDVIKKCDKELVFELYSRLVLDYKEYDETTSNEMIEEISNFYNNPNNIINICTTKELKILKKVLNKEITYQNYQDNYWEIRELNNKFLVFLDKEIIIPKEFISYVEEALNSIDFQKTNHKDELNEILIGIVKSFASIPLPLFLNISSTLLNKDEQYILEHISNDKLFQYHVYLDTDYIEEINEEYNTLIYQDYFKYLEDIDDIRNENKLICQPKSSKEDYINIFYNDFNINNKKVKTLVDKLKDLFEYKIIIKDILEETRVLNKNRDKLINTIKDILKRNNITVDNIVELINEALNNIPSPVLNGMTPNELIKYNKELEEYKDNKETFNKKQEKACLSKSDASLFYKIYLALLEFTNNKYKINKVKLYNQININPESIEDIIKKYWEEKDNLTQEFISKNPYNFTEEELSITNSFSKGIRNTYIIAKYEKDYTVVLDGKKIYMIKGINCNIDKIIPSSSLPYFVETSLIEFKDNIIYDSILFGSPIEFGLEMKKMIDDELKKGFRNYHL